MNVKQKYIFPFFISLLFLFSNEVKAQFIGPVMTFADFISPNGDDLNDTFVIHNLEHYPENNIRIFNIYGDQIFNAAPYENNWDGKNYSNNSLLGDILPEGVYFYRFEYIDNGFTINYNGKITLKR